MTTLPDPSRLAAITWELDAESGVDPVALAADDGHLVAGRARVVAGEGVAATLHLPHGLDDERALTAIAQWLERLERVHVGPDARAAHVSMQPVALGAFGFDRGAPATLVVPRTAWCRDAEGRTWAVRVQGRDDPLPSPEPPSVVGAGRAPMGPPGSEPSRVDALRAIPAPSAFAGAVARAVADIRSGVLDKVVLARLVEVDLTRPPAPSVVIDRLWEDDPVFMPYSLPTSAGRLVGATPELVVQRTGATVTSHAFAGTVALGEPATVGAPHDADGARLLHSAKERAEHRYVVDEIARALAPVTTDLSVPTEPSVVRLHSDARLGTLIHGSLRSPGPRGAPATALVLLSLLHPTPAVGGVPRAQALALIAELEPVTRGHWAGVVGWTDATGDGEWLLAIRSAVIDDRVASVWAGAGIVADSDPHAELAETSVKLAPVLEALAPGSSRLLAD